MSTFGVFTLSILFFDLTGCDNFSDKPTPPRDVKVTDVYRDNCIVHWRPPVDDGGTQIIDYLIEAIDLTSNCAQWNVIGQAKEQKFKAINLEEGHRYKFRVSAVNKLGQSAPCMIKGDGVLIKDPWGNDSLFSMIHVF